MFVYDMTNHNNETSNAEYHNASFVLKVPSSQQCRTGLSYRFQVEYLHSYTTPGVAELFKWVGGDEHINSSSAQLCEEEKEFGWELVDSFNASNSEKLLVSGSKMFDICLCMGVTIICCQLDIIVKFHLVDLSGHQENYHDYANKGDDILKYHEKVEGLSR